MSYILNLEKPTNLRGREHGLIRGYQSFYDWLINQPTNNLTTDDAMRELKNRLIKLGCTHLEVEYYPEYLDANEGV